MSDAEPAVAAAEESVARPGAEQEEAASAVRSAYPAQVRRAGSSAAGECSGRTAQDEAFPARLAYGDRQQRLEAEAGADPTAGSDPDEAQSARHASDLPTERQDEASAWPEQAARASKA